MTKPEWLQYRTGVPLTPEAADLVRASMSSTKSSVGSSTGLETEALKVEAVKRSIQVIDSLMLTPPYPTRSWRSAREPKVANDGPSREEIDAKLAAAEARTETRFVELRGDMDTRMTAIDGRLGRLDDNINRMVNAVSSLEARIAVSDDIIRGEAKSTRTTMIVTGIGAILSVFALVFALWQAGLSVDANIFAAISAGREAASAPQASPAPDVLSPPAAEARP